VTVRPLPHDDGVYPKHRLWWAKAVGLVLETGASCSVARRCVLVKYARSLLSIVLGALW
jgi:hypothetical protein